MFGNNRIMGLVKNDGDYLEVVDVFATFQGEGPFVGCPAVFLRLGGCNLACKFCDTEFDNMTKINIENVIAKIKSLSEEGKRRLVVITGGEPMRQPIEKLCESLIALNFSVQIETNGTIYRRLHPDVSVVCSPKNTGRGYNKIRKDLLGYIDAFKFIISKNNNWYNNVPDLDQDNYNIPVYLQPMDEYDELKNKTNLELVKTLASKYGYKISLQTHKIMGIE